ncbi:hypothetical protein [Pyxidicoccus caerfyrddinensis]|uniref:hypothetical protein n=1 Tax=Pyxidicoccus caerfyrddinensis TaxID=2709663 RepID=UPI0013DBC121|nr:hypothetical protein [Pyxidicoccus caerfyrddinensis]
MRTTQRPLTAAEQQLVPGARRVVWWAVHRFIRHHPVARGYEDDLASYGWLGAIYAAQRWSPDGGASFRTFTQRPVKRFVARGWLALVGVVRDEHGAYVERQEVPLDDVLNVVVPPTQERAAEARRLGASIGERLCAHMRPGTTQPVREKAVRAYLLHLQGETLEAIGAEFGATRQRAHQVLTLAEQAALRWAASMKPHWERSAA